MSGDQTMQHQCPDCPHNRVTRDRFAPLPGVRRQIPGDCVCADCGAPVPVYWDQIKCGSQDRRPNHA